VETLLNAELRINGAIAWTVRGQSVTAWLPVANSQGQEVRMHLRIVRRFPQRYHFVLCWDDVEMRKLDVRSRAAIAYRLTED
jgi:hypothetical protein